MDTLHFSEDQTMYSERNVEIVRECEGSKTKMHAMGPGTGDSSVYRLRSLPQLLSQTLPTQLENTRTASLAHRAANSARCIDIPLGSYNPQPVGVVWMQYNIRVTVTAIRITILTVVRNHRTGPLALHHLWASPLTNYSSCWRPGLVTYLTGKRAITGK